MPAKDVRGKRREIAIQTGNPPPIGRPTKLTPQLQDRICNILADGNYISTACQAVGIIPWTYEDWLARAKLGEEPFASFSTAVKEAQAQAEVKLLGIIKTAAVDTWQAAAWILERTRPDRYARRWRPEEAAGIKFTLSLWGNQGEEAKGSIIEGEAKVLAEFPEDAPEG